VDRAEKMDIPDADDAVEKVVSERKRPEEMDSSDGAGMGRESTINCPLLNALERKDFRSSREILEKSAGPRVLRAAWRAAIGAVALQRVAE